MAPEKALGSCEIKVKSFTYERNWTGKYYRQRLLPSMKTMDNHIASMLSDGWEIRTETSHSGNSHAGFGLLRNATASLFRFEKPPDFRLWKKTQATVDVDTLRTQ